MENKQSDAWETPKWLFDELDSEFDFVIDLCATRDNTKKLDFCEDYLDYVASEQQYQCAFMNPPYSNPKPFIVKAWEDSKYHKIVILVPNTIKTCKYIDILDENAGQGTFRKWKRGVEIRDLSRRTRFTHPHKQSSSPSFGCMLIVMDRGQHEANSV